MKQFGGNLTASLQARYERSENWRHGQFTNLEETSMDFSFQSLPRLLYKQFFEKAGRTPKQPIPVVPFNVEAFLRADSQPKFIWYGHSVVLIRWMNKTILIDPMLGPNAAPIAPFAARRFSENTLDLIEQFPPIDLLLMTHDHYDHLDLASMERLIPKTAKWCVSLGVGRHLQSWGVDPQVITELDWWDQVSFEGLEITCTPSRHFSGRGLRDRAKSLWGGWVIRSHGFKLFWSGDGGYGDHFKRIGERFGPFDMGFMECGQYNENWHRIHMYPEESVQAARDVGVQLAVPVHWGAFSLAPHRWKDPVERFTAAAASAQLDIATPAIGELFYSEPASLRWWEQY